jgi:hypothetical protein
LHEQFADYALFLIDHPPPDPMLWVLVELLKDTADLVVVLEDRQRQEHRDETANGPQPNSP